MHTRQSSEFCYNNVATIVRCCQFDMICPMLAWYYCWYYSITQTWSVLQH